MSKLPFELTGCNVKQVKWNSTGVRITLSGTTDEGTSVDGCCLTLSFIANLYELQDFLKNQRSVEKKSRKGTVLDKKTKKWVDRTVVVTIEKLKPYPLKLPSRLTHFSISKSTQASYGDALFTNVHGKPPKAVGGQKTLLFALDEKRFCDRKPFPIICEEFSIEDKKGKPLDGKQETKRNNWSEEEYRRLGLTFFEALAVADNSAVDQMLTIGSRKRVKKLKLEKLASDFHGVADRMAQAQPIKVKGSPISWFRKMMRVDVELDPRFWDTERGPGDPPLSAMRAQLTLSTECLRETLSVYVIEEDGEMRIEM
ncbi:MAG: hypothetical protein U0930_08720 [Pirellulales bacterium]